MHFEQTANIDTVSTYQVTALMKPDRWKQSHCLQLSNNVFQVLLV